MSKALIVEELGKFKAFQNKLACQRVNNMLELGECPSLGADNFKSSKELGKFRAFQNKPAAPAAGQTLPR